MGYEFYRFKSPGGSTPLYPPALDLPFLLGPKMLAAKDCDQIRSLVLKHEKELMKLTPMVPVAGRHDGLTTRWLSYNVVEWDDPSIHELKRLIAQTYLTYLKRAKIPRWENRIQCWGNVHRNDEILEPHYHNYRQRPILSATISLTTSPTKTVFTFPFALQKEGTKDFVHRVEVPTVKGNIIMAPGWVTHHTTPTGKKAPRVTLGLDIVTSITHGTLVDFDKGKGKIFS